MTDPGAFKYGGTTQPLDTASSKSPLELADPTIFHALAFYSAMITRYVGPRLMQEIAAVGPIAKTTGANGIGNPVAMAVGYDPTPWLTQNQFKFPLLAVHRKTEAYTDRTVIHRRNIVEAEVLYVFPPLTAAQAQRVLPFRKALSQLIAFKTDQGADQSYTPPGATLGSSVWEAAGLDMINIVGGGFGGFAAAEDLFMPAWQGRLEIVERTDIVPGVFEALGSIADNIGVAEPGTVTLDNVAQVLTTIT